MAFPNRLLNEGEQVVVSTRSHPKALIVPALALVAVLAISSWLTVVLEGPGGLWDWVVLVAGAVVLAGWVLRPFMKWLTTTYTFTDRRFIKRSGLVSKEGRTIPLNRISGVDFEIGVVDRIFGCGTLVVSDASADGQVELHDIPRVEQVQMRVSEELHLLSGADRRDDGA